MLPALPNKSTDPTFRFTDANAIRAWAFQLFGPRNLKIEKTGPKAIRVQADLVPLRSNGGAFAVVDSSQISIADTMFVSRASADAMVIAESEDLSALDSLPVILRDSAGVEVGQAYAKAGSGGITYGSELVANGGFPDTSNWTPGNDAILTSEASGESGNCLQIQEDGTDNPKATQEIATDQDALYEFSLFNKEGNQGSYQFKVGSLIDSGVKAAGAAWAQDTERFNTESDATPEIALIAPVVGGSGPSYMFTEDLEADMEASGALLISSEDLSVLDGLPITVTDGSGNEATAYAKAGSGAMAYGPNLVNNGTFDTNLDYWTQHDNALLSLETGGVSGNCMQVRENGDGYAYGFQTITGFVAEGLYQTDSFVKASIGGSFRAEKFLVANGSIFLDYAQTFPETDYEQMVMLTNLHGVTSLLVFLGLDEVYSQEAAKYDNVQLRRITAPGATGVEIYQDSGLTTRGWTSVDAGFDPNDIVSVTATGPYVPKTIQFDTVSCKRITAPGAAGLELYSDAGFTTRGFTSTGAGNPNDVALITLAGSEPGIDTNLDLTKVGAGGLDSGELSNGLYAVWVIANDDNNDGVAGNVSCIASKSFAEPAIPAGYTHKRLQGFFLMETVDDVMQVAPFVMIGSRHLYKTEQLVLETGTITKPVIRQALDLSALVPPYATKAYVRAMIQGGAAPLSMSLYVPGRTDPKQTVDGDTEDFTPSSIWMSCPNQKIDYEIDLTTLAGCWLYINGCVFKPAGGALR